MARFAVYEAEAVELIVSNIPIKENRAKGTFVKLTVPEKYGTMSGTDGSVTRYKINDRVTRAEVTLLTSSSHNQQLSALHILDDNATNGAGVGAFLLKDNNGATLVSSAQCWVAKAPDWELGEEVKEVVWTFDLVEGKGTSVYGGNG